MSAQERSELKGLSPLRNLDLILLSNVTVFPRPEGASAQQGRMLLLARFLLF